MSALLPCPFCGGDAAMGHIRYSRALDDTAWEDESPITEANFVNCVSCGAVSRSGIVGGYRTAVEAVAAWNTRQSSIASLTDAPDAVREALSPEYRNLVAAAIAAIQQADALDEIAIPALSSLRDALATEVPHG